MRGASAKSRRAASAAVLSVVLGATGCAGIKQLAFAPHLGECEGFDVPLSTLTVSSRKELRVRVLGPGVDHDFPFVVESGADQLVLVAFTPLGTKAFTLVRKTAPVDPAAPADDEKDEDDVEIESFVGPAPPVPPRNVMADVLAMSVPSSCAATPEGVATAAYDGWQLSDTCRNGRPFLRHIARADAKEGAAPAIEVEYREDAIVVRQHHCRYNARYVLQASAAPVDAGEDVSAEGEE